MIQGKPMIQWVYEKAKAALTEVIIATDDARIEAAALAFGAQVVMTSLHHSNGTSRCKEVVEKLRGDYTHVINIQGDEPLLNPEDLKTLVDTLLNKKAALATLVYPIDNEEDLLRENQVYVVLDQNQRALYFSRAVIPVIRDLPKNQWFGKHTFYKHLGLYGYTVDALNTFAELPASALEITESLEQNRWLEAGKFIYCGFAKEDSTPVDTALDLEKVRKIISSKA
jgi:3-deoxy-manno-octulosonate cytidylyltransferase (CMP-KDO synthetase)